jgi:hypothetical protein
MTVDDAGPLSLRADLPVSFLARLFNRRPHTLEVREKGLVICWRSRLEFIDWPTVRGVEQVIIGMVPTYEIVIQGRKELVVGSGDRALALVQEIVRKGGLRWIHEPFSAAPKRESP